MTLSNSLLAYTDCLEVFDKAVEHPSAGVRIPMKDYEAASHFRARMHQARKLQRQENSKVYPDEDHPMHNRCSYDPFTIRIKAVGERYFLYVEPNSINSDMIEPLDKIIEDEAMPVIPQPKVEVEDEDLPIAEPTSRRF